MALTHEQAIANARHQAKLDRIVLQPMKEEGAEIRAAAADAGESLQGYCLKAIRTRMGTKEKILPYQLSKSQSIALKKLKPEYQEYILKQIDQLLDVQRAVEKKAQKSKPSCEENE